MAWKETIAYDPLIQEASKKYGLPPYLIRSVILAESGGNPKAVSKVGAQGLMQLMPATAQELGVTDPFDPGQNIDAGVRYLKQQVDRFGLQGGVAAYNAGPGNVQKYGGVPPFPETQGYVRKVLGDPEKSSQGSFMGDVGGAVNTFRRGANQASAKILSTGAQAFEALNPFGIASMISDPITKRIRETIDPEGKLTDEQKLSMMVKNPASYLTKKAKEMEGEAMAEPPTAFQKKYEKPILSVSGFPVIPSGGDLAQTTGEYMPEVLLSGANAAKNFGQAAVKRLGITTPTLQNLYRSAAASGFGGFAGGMMKGEPETAVTNAALFPMFTLGAYGLGKTAQEAGQALKREVGPHFRQVMASESGKVQFKNPLYEPPPAAGAPEIPIAQKELGFIKSAKESPAIPGEVKRGLSGFYNPLTNQETMATAQQMIAQDPMRAREIFYSTKNPTALTNAIGLTLQEHSNKIGDFGEAIRVIQHMAPQAKNQGQSIRILSMLDRLGPEGMQKLAVQTVDEAGSKAPKWKARRLQVVTDGLAQGVQDVRAKFEPQIAAAPPEQVPILNKAVDDEIAKIVRKSVGSFDQQLFDAVKSGQMDVAGNLLKKKLGIPTLSPEFGAEIARRAQDLQKLPEGSMERAMATGQLLRDITELVPPSMGRKVATVQTMAQLLNPKTIVRNLLGNTMFGALETAKDVVAYPIDRAMSVVTGQRTKAFPSAELAKAEAGGFMGGLRQGISESMAGVDLKNIGDKWEISTGSSGLPQGRTFKGPIFGRLEKIMNLSLRAPDQAFYQAAVNRSMAEQMQVAGVTSPTEEIIARAHFDGLYRTFQDDSLAARLFSGIKKAFNMGKDFGAGDILLKYPKTPGNILSRALDYSPAGFVKSVMELGRLALDKGFDQRSFVEATSRAILGSGISATAYLLSKTGLLRDTSARNSEVRAIERTAGLGQSQLNITGLARWITGGFDPNAAKARRGDTLVTYDWAVPMSIQASMGARAQEKVFEREGKLGKAGDLIATASGALEGGLDTLGDQPMIKAVTQLGQGNSFSASLTKAAEGIPSGFTPTILKQATQLFDNSTRDTRDSDPFKTALNMVLAKTPLAGMVPKKIGPFGKPYEAFQDGGNSPFNVFLNPSFVSKFKPSPQAEMVYGLYKRTGDTKVLPDVLEDKFKFYGIPFQLSSEEKNQWQEKAGTKVNEHLGELLRNPGFQQLPDPQQAGIVSQYLENVKGMVRTGVFLERNGLSGIPVGQMGDKLQKVFKENRFTPQQMRAVMLDILTFQNPQMAEIVKKRGLSSDQMRDAIWGPAQ